jgi:hypothetical protein
MGARRANLSSETVHQPLARAAFKSLVARALDPGRR